MTYRMAKMSGTWYAYDGGSVDDQVIDLEEFVNGGEIVVIGNDLVDMADLLDINIDDITVVE